MRKPNFDICGGTPQFLIIRDVGPWNEHPTITNDPEDVIEELLPMLGTRRLLYFDSMGRLDEIVVRNGKFAMFAPFQR